MKALLTLELKLAYGNIWFLFSLLISLTLAIWEAIGASITYEKDIAIIPYLTTKYFHYSAGSAYTFWIVNDMSQSASSLFFLLVPVLCCIPFAWSYLVDRNSGYESQIVIRSGRTRYLIAKLIAASLSGSTAVCIPLAINLIACMCFSPLIKPDITGVTMTGIYEESLWSWEFYNYPCVYCLYRLGLVFAFTFLWSAFVTCLSFLTKRPFSLIVAPFIALLAFSVINMNVLVYLTPQDFTPFSFLRALPTTGFMTNGWIIIGELSIMLAFIVGFVLANRSRRLI